MTQADIRPGAAASKERPDPAQRTAPPDTAAPTGSRGFTALPARPRGVALLARLSRSAAAVLPGGLAGRAEPPVAARGVLEIGSPEFRRACALMADGRFYVVRTYNTGAIGAELAVLGRRYRLPQITGRYPATLTEINALYEGAARAKARLRPGAARLLAALSDAAALRASDLKLAIRGVHADVRLKLANVEIDFGPEWSAQEARDAISWIFDHRDKGSGASTERAGQHEAFAVSPGSGFPLPDGVLALRVQKGPQGQQGLDFIVMRLIMDGAGTASDDLEGLGFDGATLEELARERAIENGLFLVAGSTGDGKSTTLVRWLERLYVERGGQISVATVEDPVEYPASGKGFIQMTAEGAGEGPARQAEYTKLLKSFVRMNPDVGMASEIRSVDDARAILQFVVSGHKVVSTIHAGGANTAIFRLLRLGVPAHELCEPGVLSLVMRQKLVPVICPDCAREATASDRAAIAARIARDAGDPAFRPRIRNHDGCGACLQPRVGVTPAVAAAEARAWGGLSGRRAIAEVVRVDNRYREFIEAKAALKAEAYWLAPVSEGGLGGITVDERVRALVAAGEVDLRDALHAPEVTDRSEVQA